MSDEEAPIDILEMVAFQAHIPSMLVGAPGTGKSAAVRALGERLGYRVIILLGSQMDPTDFSGMPQGRELGKTSSGEKIFGTVNLAPLWQILILKNKKVILFLDEYSNAPASVRSGFLTLIQDRVFANGQKVPKETVIIGGMNPVEEAADGYEMDLPTKNRFFHMSWDPPYDEWFQGMMCNWNKPMSDAEAEWKVKIVNFLRDNPRYVHKQPSEDGSELANTAAKTASEKEVLLAAWPSRRSWDNLSKALVPTDGNFRIVNRISQGLVGFEASGAFLNWLRNNETINPRDVLKDPTSVNWKSLSIDDATLLLRSILDLSNDENALEAIRVFKTIADEGRANIAAPFVPRLFRKLSSDEQEVREKIFDLARSYGNIANNA